MGCQMSASIVSDLQEAQELLSQVPTWFEGWEARLSRFRPESELNQLNKVQDEWLRVSDVLFENLRASQWAAQYSQGLFDPTMLVAIEALGYDRDFDLLMNHKTENSIGVSAPAFGFPLVKLDPARKRVRLPLGVAIDLGGISKAWAAEQAAQRLGRLAPALVDAGGDIALSGPRMQDQSWPIAVASPFFPEEDLGWLWVKEGVVATSGRDYRRWQAQGEWHHHLLDPRTGFPAETDVIAATVVGDHSWQAEAGAKAALILGAEQGLAWLNQKPEVEGLLVRETGNVVESEGMAKYEWQG
jgi:thiamine biosynthesis lipoprotein